MAGAHPRVPDGRRARTGPARHERPAIDEAALAAANQADRLLAAARGAENARWEAFLAPLPDRLRDADLRELRGVALRARAAYGPKDSVRDVLPADTTEPFVEAIDLLLRRLAKQSAEE